ncbi:MAG: hypothetical protein KF760_08105 [Candidatus Eremiobacteraeota bacterium]|nr:hypothetical protein [Candidatus Eremiobacteraeota bacterium]
MHCWNCGWRNPSRLEECELCGKHLGASPRGSSPEAGYALRLDVVNHAESAASQRQVKNPRFREVVNLALELGQGQAQSEQVEEALRRFWLPLEQFLEQQLPRIMADTEADLAVVRPLAQEGELLVRRGVREAGAILGSWRKRPLITELAQRLKEIQRGLDQLGQLRDLDEEVTGR